jgi:protein-S-isoprenylcysteine O-methyltransferase Ste14
MLSSITKKVILFVPLTFVVTCLMLFLPAGSLYYWQAWVFMGALFIPVIFTVSYFIKNDPKLLERRLRLREKEASERTLIKLGQLSLLVGIIVPGLDYRFGWSSVPFWLVILADVIVFLSYLLVFFVFKENSYASRIVEVEKKQKVISTGPYAIVRHPMYAGILPLYLAVPFALGSYYALIFFIPVIFVIIFRIFDEERLLSKNLKGYKEYMKKVKYRLIPFVW